MDFHPTFPTTTCTRCKGEGVLDAYMHVNYGICIKCGGNGRQLTREGKAAKKAWEASLTLTPVTELAEGDVTEMGTVVKVEVVMRRSHVREVYVTFDRTERTWFGKHDALRVA